MNALTIQGAGDQTQRLLDGLAKPPGSLGRLEALAVRLAAAQGQVPPRAERSRVLVFAADHGVAREEAVSPYPPEVTALMVRTFNAGKAAVCALARSAGAELEVVDVGVRGLGELPPAAPGVRVFRHPVKKGTANLAKKPAMSLPDCALALATGAEAAGRAAAEGVQLLALGEMGIGNTTAAAALAARLLGAPPEALAGPGTGLDAAGVARKVEVIRRALARGGPREPIGALADLGGFELAAMAGCILEAARLRLPVVLDGFIVGAAALAALRMNQGVQPFLFLATASAEPGHRRVIEALGVGEPLLDWGLRLGEGSGAALSLPLFRAAARLCVEVASLDDVLAGRVG